MEGREKDCFPSQPEGGRGGGKGRRMCIRASSSFLSLSSLLACPRGFAGAKDFRYYYFLISEAEKRRELGSVAKRNRIYFFPSSRRGVSRTLSNPERGDPFTQKGEKLSSGKHLELIRRRIF